MFHIPNKYMQNRVSPFDTLNSGKLRKQKLHIIVPMFHALPPCIMRTVLHKILT